MKKIAKVLLGIIIFLFLSYWSTYTVFGEEKIVMDFYYSSNCASCFEKLEIIQDEFVNNESYEEFLVITIKDIAVDETFRDEWIEDYDFYPYPFVVVTSEQDTVIVDEGDITVDYLNAVIDSVRTGGDTPVDDDGVISTPFGDIAVSGLSLPVLTMVLGAVDSLNPCAMFILFILLSLLVHTQSRRRMLLVGGIFIFFSGLWYFIFMIGLLRFLSLFEVTVLAFIVGVPSIVFGVFNVKDFFFFKKGMSLSIPERRKPGLYKQMRKLIKTPSLLGVIAGTVFFAATVNLFELVCSVFWPLYYTGTLDTISSISETQKILYIIAYNIIYVIPLVIIVVVFALTLGQKKLTEWQGQTMKLFSGIMITCFGVIFLIDFRLLGYVITPALVLVFSVLVTGIVSRLWKRYVIEKKEG
jgi:hypothetical protein